MVIIAGVHKGKPAMRTRIESAWRVLQTHPDHIRHIIMLGLDNREALQRIAELQLHDLQSLRFVNSSDKVAFLTPDNLDRIYRCQNICFDPSRLDIPVTVPALFQDSSSFQRLEILALSHISQCWDNHRILIANMPSLRLLHLHFEMLLPLVTPRVMAHIWPNLVQSAWVKLDRLPKLSSLIVENAVLDRTNPLFSGTNNDLTTLSLIGCQLWNAGELFPYFPKVEKLMVICSESKIHCLGKGAEFLPSLQVVVRDNRSSGFDGFVGHASIQLEKVDSLHEERLWTDPELEYWIKHMAKVDKDIAPCLSIQAQLHRRLSAVSVDDLR
jgi:hypothetical protein